MPSITIQSIEDEIATQIASQLPGISNTTALTSDQVKRAFNGALAAMYTVDPSKKPTVKNTIQLEF